MDLKAYIAEFDAWVKSDPKVAAKALGTFPSVVARWIAGTHKPSLDVVMKYHDEIKGKPVAIAPVKTPKPKPIPRPPKPVATVPEPPSVRAVPVPDELEEEHIDEVAPSNLNMFEKAVDWAVKNRDKLPYSVVSKLGNIFFPWEGRNLMILFPSYKFTNAATAWNLVMFALDLGKEKARYDMELGDAAIYHARNRLAAKFLKSECEWSFWIDDDMILPAGRPDWFRVIGRLPEEYPRANMEMHVIHRLMSHKKTIIGGLYYGRNPAGIPMHGDAHNPKANQDARNFKDGIRSVPWAATGCLLVHRQVYLDIMARFPNLAPNDEKPWIKEFQFFLPEEGGGEDTAFCRRAREAGHEVFVDQGLQAQHIGFASYHALNTGHPE